MSGLRRFLTPGWIIGLLAVVAFAYACFSVLAPWQLGKSDRLDEQNQRLTDSVRAEPAPIDQLLADPAAFSSSEWRLVTASGSYVPDSEVLLRLRSVDGDLVYQVLTAFRTADGREFVVNRGHIPVGENNAVPPYPPEPAGTVSITARLRNAETAPGEPITLSGHLAVRAVDLPGIASLVGRPVETRGYLQLTGDQPGTLSPMPIPALENGPYFSYGMQWIAFGVLAPLGLAYFAWSEIAARRRDAAAEGATRSVPSGGPDPDVRGDGYPVDGFSPGRSSTEPDADEFVTRARNRAMLDRYGRRHDAERTRALKRRDRLADD